MTNTYKELINSKAFIDKRIGEQNLYIYLTSLRTDISNERKILIIRSATEVMKYFIVQLEFLKTPIDKAIELMDKDNNLGIYGASKKVLNGL